MAKRVLIVDDDPGQRLLAASVCQLQGYVVHEAATAAEGLDLALEAAPDAILLDWELPDRAGPDLCREMRSEGVTCPILMLTGRAGKADVVLGLEVGADDYIVKPVDNKELAARLAAQMRRAVLVHEPGIRELSTFLEILQSTAIFSINRLFCTWYGISVTTIWNRPWLSVSFSQRARRRKLPRPVA